MCAVCGLCAHAAVNWLQAYNFELTCAWREVDVLAAVPKTIMAEALSTAQHSVIGFEGCLYGLVTQQLNCNILI